MTSALQVMAHAHVRVSVCVCEGRAPPHVFFVLFSSSSLSCFYMYVCACVWVRASLPSARLRSMLLLPLRPVPALPHRGSHTMA